MALHRDIYWLGRQWAVTGAGIQAVDQRRNGAFDIEISKLWDEDLADRMRGQAWFNLEDFGKALAVARIRYPVPSPTPANRPVVAAIAAPATQPPAVDLSKPPNLQVAGRLARFFPQWRVRR